MNYTELFREKRLEYYQDTGISCNAVLMSDYFAKELIKENDIHLYSGSKFLGVKVIKVYAPTHNYGIQIVRKVEEEG